jgi:rubrerythrin
MGILKSGAPMEPLVALRGDEFRIMCPACGVMWSTMTLPSECPDCGREVTLQIVQPRHGAQEG